MLLWPIDVLIFFKWKSLMMQPNICLQLHSLKMDQNQGIDCIMHIWRLKSSHSRNIFPGLFFFHAMHRGFRTPTIRIQNWDGTGMLYGAWRWMLVDSCWGWDWLDELLNYSGSFWLSVIPYDFNQSQGNPPNLQMIFQYNLEIVHHFCLTAPPSFTSYFRE